ncbi:hypothetical protein CU097_002528, partial [Rhizopus azygosporus]
VCVAEAADDDKLINDHSKLLRKGKDILDRPLETVMENGTVDEGKNLFIQLGVTHFQLFSIYLDDEADVYNCNPPITPAPPYIGCFNSSLRTNFDCSVATAMRAFQIGHVHSPTAGVTR